MLAEFVSRGSWIRQRVLRLAVRPMGTTLLKACVDVSLCRQIDKVLGVRYSDDWAKQNLEPTGDSDTDGAWRTAQRLRMAVPFPGVCCTHCPPVLLVRRRRYCRPGPVPSRRTALDATAPAAAAV